MALEAGQLIAAGAAIIVIVSLALIYNDLVRKAARVDNAWSQVDVELRRRYELIPQLVTAVSGYADHEQQLFTRLAELRGRARQAGSAGQKELIEPQLAQVLGAVLRAVREDYPQLAAAGNFRALQDELAQTEERLAFARMFYNETVKRYNVRIQTFPITLMAGTLGFRQRSYFTARSSVTALGSSPPPAAEGREP